MTLNATDILHDLTPPQREAVTHVDGPLLILAGAGSGKTRVVTRRVVYLLGHGVAPWNILAITFTNKAANEMKERVAALTDVQGLRISTFHAFCAREIRRFADHMGLSPTYTIYDTADRTKLISECMVALDMDTKQTRPSSVEAAIGAAKNEMLPPEQYASAVTSVYEEQVARVYARYEKEMRARGALDFDDLLVKMVELLDRDEEVRSQLETRFRYVMVDEYQDTNAAQYRIIRMLTRNHANIAVTGDPDQAIYGWRGADIRNILSFESDYPGARTILLERNYRSTRAILAAAHDLIVHNELRKEKSLFTENAEGAPVGFIEAADEIEEARAVARHVKKLMKSGFAAHDIAVFYRVNALSRTFETEFRKASIPHAVVAGTAFYDRREVRDLLAYLRVTANPGDDLACERIVNVPTRGIGDTTVERVKEYAAANGLSLLGALKRGESIDGLTAAARGAIASFVEMVAALDDVADDGPETVLKEVLDRTGYLGQFTRSDEDQERVRNVEELVNTAAAYEESSGETTLSGFLQEVALVSDQDALHDDSPTVSLMTLHAAKGLEFPAVFIVGCEERLIPHERSVERPAELEEERRLLYVGMTRAKRELTLSWALRRRRFGTFEPAERSQFLSEISREHLRKADTPALERPKAPARKKPVPGPTAGREKATLAVGDRVRHPLYGLGKVRTLSGTGPKTKAVVQFDQVGPKTLVLLYARLEKLVAE